MSDTIITINNDNFDSEILKSGTSVLVDFWAEWCGPCRAIAPILHEISLENQGKIKIAKVNVDECPELTEKYGVRGIPTLLIIKNGTVHGTKVGALTKAQLQAFIDQHI